MGSAQIIYRKSTHNLESDSSHALQKIGFCGEMIDRNNFHGDGSGAGTSAASEWMEQQNAMGLETWVRGVGRVGADQQNVVHNVLRVPLGCLNGARKAESAFRDLNNFAEPRMYDAHELSDSHAIGWRSDRVFFSSLCLFKLLLLHRCCLSRAMTMEENTSKDEYVSDAATHYGVYFVLCTYSPRFIFECSLQLLKSFYFLKETCEPTIFVTY